MNCNAYRAEILGRFTPADGARAACSAELQAHLAACVACAEFASEQEHLVTLMGSLRAMQDNLAPVQTVVRIESNLLTAFQQHRNSSIPTQALPHSSSGKVNGVPALLLSASSAIKQRSHREILRMSRMPTLWTAAMAAVLLLALGVFLRVSRAPNLPTLPSPPRLTYLPLPPQELSIIPRGTEQPLKESSESAADSTDKTIASEKYLSVDNSVSSGKSANSEGHTQAQIDGSSEHGLGTISTGGFIELTPGTPGFLAEGALVMRVRMPYAAVQYLGVATGLPYTQAAAAGSVVQADLLVGGDGTARAIRFVQ